MQYIVNFLFGDINARFKNDIDDIYKSLDKLYKDGKYKETIESIHNCELDLGENPNLLNLMVLVILN